MENSEEVPQEIKNRTTTCDSAIPLLKCNEELKADSQNICTPMFITVLFTIAK